MLFTYQITDDKGKNKKGTLEAATIKEARNRLTLQEGTLVSLAPVAKRGNKKRGSGGDITFGHIKLIEKLMFAKHLSVMIKSGMSIDGSIEVLMDGASPLMVKRLRGILSDVRKGNSLSTALKQYSKDFDNLFINMVAAGETGGTLSKNLELLSIQQRKSYDLKHKIKAASIYPTVILLAVVGLTVVISIFVLPKIIGFFDSLNVQLPLSTRILMAVASFFVANWMWVVIALAALIASWHIMMRFAITRIRLHGFILAIPIIGKITHYMNLAIFCRTLSSLLDSGITIDQALQTVSQTVTNDVYKKEIIKIYHKVLKGSSLADAMGHKKYFPIIVSRMSRVGEESGNLTEVLKYLAGFYETEVDDITKNLSTMLEPFLLAVIGLVVGFVAMSIINPIYDLTSQVGA